LYEEELKKKEAEQERHRLELEKIQNKLLEKEKQLLSGGQELDKAAKTKADLARAEEELKIRREREEATRAHLAQVEEDQLYMTDQYSSKQDELDKKGKKLKLLWTKYCEKKNELEDIHVRSILSSACSCSM
jgi:hypothetical protein